MAVTWGRDRLDLTGVSALGVDEIYWKKGKFLTLVYQINEGMKRLLFGVLPAGVRKPGFGSRTNRIKRTQSLFIGSGKGIHSCDGIPGESKRTSSQQVRDAGDIQSPVFKKCRYLFLEPAIPSGEAREECGPFFGRHRTKVRYCMICGINAAFHGGHSFQ